MRMDRLTVLKGNVIINRYFDGKFTVIGGVYDEKIDDVLDVVLEESDIDKDAYYYVEVESFGVELLLVEFIDS